jgi:hypothetical protein
MTSDVMRSLAEPVFCRSTVVSGRGRLQCHGPKVIGACRRNKGVATRTSARLACTARW